MKNWKEIACHQDDKIISALEQLNTIGSQFLVVVDGDDKLLGTITDGDIRRGLLKGIKIEDKIGQIMNVNPTVLPLKVPRADAFKMMREKDFNHLPLVDDLFRIVEIISLNDFLKVDKKDNHVVLMAGGLGTRLESLTSNCPKPMLKVGGKPILETIIDTFKEHGFYKFIIAVNYKSEMIESYFKDGKKFNVEINYLREKERAGTAGALSLYDFNNGLPFIVMNGDLLTKINFSELINTHSEKNNVATMCLRQYEHQIPFGVVLTEDDQVTKIEEKPMKRYFVNSGIYVLSPEVLPSIPKDTYYDMPKFFEDLIAKDKKVGAYAFYDYWIDVGRMDDYEKAHFDFNNIFINKTEE